MSPYLWLSVLVVANNPRTDIALYAAAGKKGIRTKAARGVFASNAEGPRVATRERPSSPGFFDNAVGSQFANKPTTPTKAAPTSGKLLVVMAFNSRTMKRNCMSTVQHSEAQASCLVATQKTCGLSVSLQFVMISNCAAGASRPSSSRPSSSRPSSPGFFDSAVGAQFAKKSEAPAKAASKQPSSSSRPASSGGGFFDSAIGSQFAKRNDKWTPGWSPNSSGSSKSSSSSRPSSPGFFDSAVGSQFAKKSGEAAPKQPASSSRPSSSSGKRLGLMSKGHVS